MHRHTNEYWVGHDNVRIENILILIAHSGKVFDIPILMQQLSVHRLVDTFLQDERIGLGLDTLQLARKSIQENRTVGVPVVYNLAALHQYVTSNPPSVFHHAMADVKATITIFFYKIFWQNRGKFLFSFRQQDKMEVAVLLKLVPFQLWKLLVVMTLTPASVTIQIRLILMMIETQQTTTTA
jgi:hypothetical protein